MSKKAFVILLMTSLTSCEDIFLGEDELNNPENNFEILWNDFDQHYSLFGVRGWDWDSIYSVYRPQVSMQTTDAELWGIFKEMVGYLDDSHTFILQPNNPFIQDLHFYESGAEKTQSVPLEFSRELVKSKYIENRQDITYPGTDYGHFHGKIKDKNIGYLFMNGFDLADRDLLDDILPVIGEYDAIIFDIRNNTGGDDEASADFAGRFADGHHFVYTVEEKRGPAHDDFTDKIAYYTRKKGKQHYTKPVIILTDQWTVSAAEIFLLHMKSFAQVVQMGDSTAGDFSDTSMRRFLPNGWQYQYSIFKFLLPTGESLDGIGHVPDIYVRNAVSDIEAENDVVLERAMEYLLDNHGID